MQLLLKPISQLRFDYDTTTTRLRRKIDMLIFCSRRIASNGSRRARYVVVVSQSNRNFDHFRRSRMRRDIVVYDVSQYCRNRIAIVRLLYDYDSTTTYRARLFPFDAIRREQKINMSVFCHGVLSQSYRSRIAIVITALVVESQCVKPWSHNTAQVWRSYLGVTHGAPPPKRSNLQRYDSQRRREDIRHRRHVASTDMRACQTHPPSQSPPTMIQRDCVTPWLYNYIVTVLCVCK